MNALRFAQVTSSRPPYGDLVRDWQLVHNTIIPAHVLTLDEISERAGRNLLEVAYEGAELIGCSTVRPPSDDEPTTVTVIVRVLPAHRGRGLGAQLYERALAAARKLGGEGGVSGRTGVSGGTGVSGVSGEDRWTVETVVLASNPEGVRFARALGFEVVEEYVLPGESIPWFTLRLA